MAGRTIDDGGVRWSGLVLAVVGFTLSRFTVASSVTMDDGLSQFALTSAVPMVLAFGLVILGLVLTVSSVDRGTVRTISTWCVLGVGAMMAAVIVSALDTQSMRSMGRLVGTENGSFAINTVLGGAVGGTLIGIYAARASRRNRRITAQADRLHLLNRLLRDEVLNSITVILAHADFLGDEGSTPDDHVEPLARNAEHIQTVIEDVGELTDETAPEDRVFERLSVMPLVDQCAETLEMTHEEAVIDVSGDTDAAVYADEQLGVLFDQLLSNAVEHTEAEMPRVEVSIETEPGIVAVTIADDGPGLDEAEQALLESGDLSRYDRPSEGFGLWIVRILLDRYSGSAEVTVDDGTAVTITLPRADVEESERTGSFGVGTDRLVAASVAGLLAGVAMGVTLQTFTNILPVIGSLYGSQSAAVGWITHLFHSVVFAVAFATALSFPQLKRVGGRLVPTTVVAVVFGTVLWFVAAGVVMPAWLNVVGLPVSIPRLRIVPLVGHLLWGALLGPLFCGLVRLDGVGPFEKQIPGGSRG